MTRVEKMREWISLTTKAEAIEKSGASPEVIYDIIFSDEISAAIRELGFPSMGYYDPDSSYEEDVRAYIRALRERANEYQKILDVL